MHKKKNKNVVFIIFVILFGVYLALYYAFLGGYYEYKAYNKKNLTEEMMKKFETDVSNGKDVSIYDYIEEEKDYSNNVSNLGVKLGEVTEDFLTKGLGGIFKVVSKLVTN